MTGRESIPSYVLDAFALLAYFQREPGYEKVVQLLESAAARECRLAMSVVNLGEVAYIVERGRGLEAAYEVLARVDRLPVDMVDADRNLTLMAAHLKARWPIIAYADCFALALAQREGATLVTGDPEFARAEEMVAIEWLGKGGT